MGGGKRGACVHVHTPALVRVSPCARLRARVRRREPPMAILRTTNATPAASNTAQSRRCASVSLTPQSAPKARRYQHGRQGGAAGRCGRRGLGGQLRGGRSNKTIGRSAAEGRPGASTRCSTSGHDALNLPPARPLARPPARPCNERHSCPSCAALLRIARCPLHVGRSWRGAMQCAAV